MQWWVVPMFVGISAVVISVLVYLNTALALPMMVKAPTSSKVVSVCIVAFLMIAHTIVVGAVVGFIARFCRITPTEPSVSYFKNNALLVLYYLVPAFVWYRAIVLAERRYFKKYPPVQISEG